MLVYLCKGPLTYLPMVCMKMMLSSRPTHHVSFTSKCQICQKSMFITSNIKLGRNLGQTKLCHHPLPSTTNHHQPKYIHHHPPPAKMYPPPHTTTQDISTNTHHHPPTAKTFIRNPFIRISSHCLKAT